MKNKIISGIVATFVFLLFICLVLGMLILPSIFQWFWAGMGILMLLIILVLFICGIYSSMMTWLEEREEQKK